MFLKKDDGIRIFYQTYGSKDDTPIILIHGLGSDHNMYEPQIDKYPKKGFYLIVADMRGHGKSSNVESLTLSDWTRDIKDLMDELNLDKAIFLGVSMGGVIVQKFVTEYPKRVDKFILSDTFAEIKSMKEKIAAYSQILGFKLFKYLPKSFVSKIVASPYKSFSNELFEYFKETTEKVDFEQLVIARKAINKIDILDDLNKVSVSALVMAGDKGDIMIRPARKIVNNLNDVEFKIINGALDPSNMTKPEIFDKYVLNFIS